MATTSKFDFGLINDQIKAHTDQIAALGPYNGLDSDSTAAALSAAQGKVLNGKINDIIASEIYTQLGLIYNLNVSNRQAGKSYFFKYTSTASNNPSSGNGGSGMLYTNNDSPNYGIQFAFGNRGIWARGLENGDYRPWSTILSIV